MKSLSLFPRLLCLCALFTAARAAEIPAEPAALGKVLCESVDLNTPGLERMRDQAKAGRYTEALKAWRDYKILELRKTDLGQFNWHDDQPNNWRLASADYLIGNQGGAANEAPKLQSEGFFKDIYGMREFKPGKTRINWLAPSESDDPLSGYANFFFAIPFAVRYSQGGETVYVDKFFQITADFAIRQKALIESLPDAQRKRHFCGWTVNAQSALSQADRVSVLIRILAVICRSLPDEGPERNWSGILEPRSFALSPRSSEIIPAVELAQIGLSLVNDHPVALSARYLKAGAVPNQRRAGLCALVMIATQFPEFKASKLLLTQSSEGLKDYLSGAFQRDGGMLEQSFNYNIGDARSLEELSLWLKPHNPELAADLDSKKSGFFRMAAGLLTPFGKLPALSSQGSPNPTDLWTHVRTRRAWFGKEAEALATWQEPLAKQIAGTWDSEEPGRPPSFTSVAFPFSGYYIQRGGWSWDSPYLFFQGSRQSRGHSTQGSNSIQVSAFGRPLLVMAGVPAYTIEQLPEELRPEFSAINELLGEDSSWKTNTVLVDNSSQRRLRDPAQVGFEKPVQSRWYTSPVFDYLEGNYELGYTAAGTNNIGHSRQVVYVREAGVWIVVDVMKSSDAAEHVYSQNWILPGESYRTKASVEGFKQEDVKVNELTRTIATWDSAGPNVTLRHFGLRGSKLNYVHSFGAKKPWRGWFATGFGSLHPAHQVVAVFPTKGNATLITVIQPRAVGDVVGLSVTDLSPPNNPTAAACRISLPKGQTLSVFALDRETPMAQPHFKGNAQLLVTLETPSGVVQGLALTERGAPGSHAFTAQAGQIMAKTPITIPQDFKWVETPAGLTPVMQTTE